MRTDQEYWDEVGTLRIYQEKGTASYGFQTVNYVDWSPVLPGNVEASAKYELGWDPRYSNMVDGEAKFWPINQVEDLKLRATASFKNHEARIAALEKK